MVSLTRSYFRNPLTFPSVDRILRQQRADQEAAQAEANARTTVNLISKPQHSAPPPIPPKSIQGPPPPPYLQPESSNSGGPTPKPTMFQNLRKKLLDDGFGSGERKADEPPSVPDRNRAFAQPPPGRNRNQGVTPRSNICGYSSVQRAFNLYIVNCTASNIDMAVKACRPEHGNLLRNAEQMQQVRESLEDGYCDISGRVGDLKYVGKCSRLPNP